MRIAMNSKACRCSARCDASAFFALRMTPICAADRQADAWMQAVARVVEALDRRACVRLGLQKINRAVFTARVTAHRFISTGVARMVYALARCSVSGQGATPDGMPLRSRQ